MEGGTGSPTPGVSSLAASSGGCHTRERIEHGTQVQCCPWAVAASSEGKKGVNDIVVDDQDDVRTAWTAIIDRLFLARFVLLHLPAVLPRRAPAGCPYPPCLSLTFPPGSRRSSHTGTYVLQDIHAPRFPSTCAVCTPRRAVASSLPQARHPASLAFQHVSRRAHHTSTRFCVPPALRRRSARLPHPLRAYRVSSRSTAHA